ncbi:hypothetical protein IMCC3317_19120 [Kordia antarctica]|uniref:HTH cro/C1-type domain-containing protein n=1 Tax=Kordia antarctica TaxID=1218801 RepID=A0A7L4ZJG5_9FLAO|nr:hypothetical protein [Kordia antarctica]QHI36549.1 hypothetical protein IMCC3317_19120 [Kordia antarctica]
MERFSSKIKLRILKHLKDKGISNRKFYGDTGIANGVLGKKTGLTELNIEKYLNAYKEVNPTWLLTGKGNMYNLSEDQQIDINILNSNPDFSLSLLNSLVNDEKVKKALTLIIGKEINNFFTHKLLNILNDENIFNALKNQLKDDKQKNSE